MFAELILTATCIVAPGTVYHPPRGWTIEAVRAQGTQDICQGNTCYAIVPSHYKDTTVTVSRAITPGEQVKAPDGCEVIATIKEPKRE